MKARALVGPGSLPTIVLVVLGAAVFLLLPDYLLYTGSAALVSGLIALGLYLPIAALRVMPLNAAGIAGLSAYLFSQFTTHGGAGGYATGALLGLGSAVAVSVLTGLASLAVTGIYFVVATLVVQLALEKVVFSIPAVTGGAQNWTVAQPDLSGWLTTQRAIYLITAAVVICVALGVRALMRTRWGFGAMLVGHQPDGASAMGLRNSVIKLLVFAVSGLVIGLGGMLTAFVDGTPPAPVFFGVIFSVVYLAILVASGMGRFSSIWLVAAAFTAVPTLLEQLHLLPDLIAGSILLSAVVFGQSRHTLGARARRIVRRALSRSAARAEVAETVPALVVDRAAPDRVWAAPPDGRAVHSPSRSVGLDARGITVDFGGVRAVDDVSFALAPGQRVGIVGANGAGKTTLVNTLTGFVRPQRGTVLLGPTDITGWRPLTRARAGVRRTFQFPTLADVLTAEQNVICVQGYGGEHRDRVDWLLDRFDLGDRRTTPTAELSFGQRRKLELVRALATRPQVLVLDEPTGGLMDEQAANLVDVLLELQRAEGWGLLVIEHNPWVLTSLTQRLVVLENGRLLVEGPTDAVIGQEEVRRVYLGRGMDHGAVPGRVGRVAVVTPRTTVMPAVGGGNGAEPDGLRVRDLHLDYGPMPVLRGVDLDCRPGCIVGVVGGNGVGKTSLLAGIAGLVPTSKGVVQLDGRDVSRWPAYRRGQAGMVMVAERRRVLPSLSVRDNLVAGGYGLDRDEVEARVDGVLRLFPRIAERLTVPAYRLSGGEQRMVSIGRALVTGARCLLLDEFSLSLSPRMVDELTEIIRALADEGRVILLVEQYIGVLLEIADVAHVLQRGRLVFGGPSDAAAGWLESHGHLARARRASRVGVDP